MKATGGEKKTNKQIDNSRIEIRKKIRKHFHHWINVPRKQPLLK